MTAWNWDISEKILNKIFKLENLKKEIVFRILPVKMEANIKAVMAEATEVDAELNGSNNISGMVVVDNRGLCIAAEVNWLHPMQ